MRGPVVAVGQEQCNIAQAGCKPNLFLLEAEKVVGRAGWLSRISGQGGQRPRCDAANQRRRKKGCASVSARRFAGQMLCWCVYAGVGAAGRRTTRFSRGSLGRGLSQTVTMVTGSGACQGSAAAGSGRSARDEDLPETRRFRSRTMAAGLGVSSQGAG